MTQNIPSENELQVLLNGLVDGTLSSDDQARLSELVRTDATARDLYLAYIHLHAELLWRHGAIHDLPVMRPSAQSNLSPSFSHPASLSTVLARAIEWRHHPIRFWGTVATLTFFFLATLAVWIAPWRQAGNQVAQPPQAGHGGRPVFVARVLGNHAASEQPGSAAVFHGAHLQPGQTILLDSGLVKIRFQDGAETIVEGPAEFTVVDSNRGHLEIGRLVAHITTPTAAGFRIDTPKSTIVDLGTEFGLDVDEHGDHDVSVFQGSVQVRLAQLGSREPITVRRGQTLRVDGAESALVRSSGSSEKFVRRLSISGQTVSPDTERLTEAFDHLTAAPAPGWNLNGQGGWNVVHGRLRLRNDDTTGRFDRHVAFGTGRAYRVLDDRWQTRLATSKQIVCAVTAMTGGHYSKVGLGYFDGARFHVGFVVGDDHGYFAAYAGSGQGDSLSIVGTSQHRYPETETIADYRLTLDLATMTGTLQVDTGNGYFVPRGMERLDFSMLSETGESGRNVRLWNSLYLRGIKPNDAWDNLRLTCLPTAEATPQKPPTIDTLEP